MTKHFCDRCRQEAKEYDLTEIGARAASRDNTALFRAQDIELCKTCWEELEEFLKPLPVLATKETKITEKPDARIIELCDRLTSPGSTIGKLSASELHEICDFVYRACAKTWNE